MIKTILFFLLVWIAVSLGIEFFRDATKKERWSVAKTTALAFVTALIAVTIVILIVVIF